MTPQQKRVLAAARSYNGTCSADWADDMGADGKGKILRWVARREELERDHDCVFEVIGWRCKTKVFRLVSGPSGSVESDRGGNPSRQSVGASTVAVNASDRLFEPEATQPASHWQAG